MRNTTLAAILSSRLRHNLRHITHTVAISSSRKLSTSCAELEASIASNGLAIITLNRPRALNALTAHRAALAAANHADNVKCILLESAAPKAFCSGGDIKYIRQIVLDAPYSPFPPLGHPMSRVFQAEYGLVCEAANSLKPTVALCNGIWMGSGVGIAAHGDIRVVTERTLCAMPEAEIGLFPDVGFARLAARAPGALGIYLALTGRRVNHPGDLIHAGLATHHVASDALPGLRAALLETPLPTGKGSREEALSALEDCITPFQTNAEPGPLVKLQPAIDACFGAALQDGAPHVDRPQLPGASTSGPEPLSVQETLDTIAAELLACILHGDEQVRRFGAEALEALQRMCPFSLAVTLRHFSAVYAATHGEPTAAALASIEGLMQQEYNIAVRLAARPDFAEGVRAMLVDKDKRPHWQPGDLGSLQEKELAAVFAPVPDGCSGLQLP